MNYSYFGGMICCFIFDLISFGIFDLCFGKWYIYILICFGGVLIFSLFFVHNSKLIMEKYDKNMDLMTMF